MNKNPLVKKTSSVLNRIDYPITFLPFLSILVLCVFFILAPEGSSFILGKIRSLLNDRFGIYYLVMGLGMFLFSLYIAFSSYGNIRLGSIDRPEHSHFKWGSMMFTAGLAADILFYSLCEWMLYAEEMHIHRLEAATGEAFSWAGTYPLFHWGPIPWSFYMVLAAAFGFMIHVRNTNRQKYSEACRPVLGKQVEKWPGRLIDLIAVFALIAGTATTFSLATPLLSMSIGQLFSLETTPILTIIILVIICVIYSACAYMGIDGVSKLAASCTYLFFALLLYIFFFGGLGSYILETGFASLGRLADNFFILSTNSDPLRETGFAQNWTIFYWAYWMVWCVATPFFIGSISKGRTIRQTILGGYAYGILGTYVSFIVLGNYGLGLQTTGRLDILSQYREHGDLYRAIMRILQELPLFPVVCLLLILAMITFYATSFDTLTLIASAYSYKSLKAREEPDKRIKLFWSILLILLPIALLFSENSMTNLQTVSIIAAFPVGIIMILIVWGFLKDGKKYLSEKKEDAKASE